MMSLMFQKFSQITNQYYKQSEQIPQDLEKAAKGKLNDFCSLNKDIKDGMAVVNGKLEEMRQVVKKNVKADNKQDGLLT